MPKILAQEPVNSGRQIELDIARGLAVFFMVLVHVQILFALDSVQNATLGLVVDFLGGIPAAPVFMFLLGIGINYTRKSEPRIFVKRGLKLLVAGYALNLIRAIVPYLIKWFLTQWEEYLILALEGLIYVDILQFAGLALILLGLLKMTHHRYSIAAAVSLTFALINFTLLNVKTSGYISSALTGLLWGSNDASYFPFLTWIWYPLAGFLFGALLIHCADKNGFYRVCLGGAILALTLSASVALAFDLDMGLSSDYSYYHHTLLGNIIFTAFVVGWLSGLYFLTRRFPAWFSKALLRWSNNVTSIYLIHWVLIGVGLLFIEFNTLDVWAFIGIFLLIMGSSDALAVVYQRKTT